MKMMNTKENTDKKGLRDMSFTRTMFIALVAIIITFGLLTSISFAATVDIGDGTDPANFSAEQASTGNYINAFSITHSGGGQKAVTSVTVTTTNTSDLSNVEIRSSDGLQTYGNSTTPSGDNWVILMNVVSPADLAVYVDVDPGATVSNVVTAYVTDFVTSGTKGSVSDAAGTQMTIIPQPVPDSLSFVSNTPVAASPVTEGTQDVQMQRIEVTCTDGGANDGNCLIESIVVEDAGTDNTGAIANLEVHLDTDTTFPGNESVQDAAYNGTQKTIDLTSLSSGLRTVSDAGTLYIWIVYDLNGSTAGKDVTSRVTAVNVDASQGDTGASGTWDSNNLSIQTASGPESLTVNTNNPVATTASQGVSNVQMQWILVDCNDNGGGGDGFCNIDSVTVDDFVVNTTGTIDLLQVHFDDDANFGNGTLGSNSVSNWNGESVAVDMTAASGRTLAINTSRYIWILYDISATAPLSFIESRVSAVTLNQSVEADVSPSGGPWNSNNFQITAPVPDSLSVTTNTAVATTATGGDQNVQMQWLQVDCAAGGGDDGICNITSVTVDDLQTGTSGKIDRLEVYMDDDSDFGNGTLGSNSVSGWDGEAGTGVVDMSGVTGNDVTAGTSKFIWIVYDLTALASGNINSSVTSIAVSGPDNPPSGGPWNSNNFTIIEANVPPYGPSHTAAPVQYKLDGSTQISAGGTTTEKTVLIKAVVTDADSTPDAVRLEVEMADGAFTGAPTCASPYVTSGTMATAACTYLDSGSQYNWKARTYDGEDFNTGGWEEVLTGDPDVIISNTAPELPNYNTDLNQYKMDGSTQISQDGLTSETTAKISATLSDADQDDIKLEVEIVDYNGGAGSYSGIPNCSSGFVSDGSVATATCKNLVDTVEYMWRARTNDGTTTSAWQDFGTATDLTVAISGASNKLIHSSSNLNSPKWAAEGGWGVDGKCDDPTYMTRLECERNSGTWTPGGKYGQFVCETCHTSDTTNIKRLKTNITAPNSPADQFPGEVGGLGIVLADQRDGTADFGDDTGGHTTSTRICEYCHSKNKYHNYNTNEPSQVTLLHNNNKDCNLCHQHKNGFAGGGECILCHDGVPLPNSYITRDIADPAVGDFTKASRHIFGGTTVTNWDCIVCHAEGDATAASNGEVLMTLKHNNSGAGGQSANGIVVDLRDVDNPGSSWAWDKYDGTCAGGSGGDDVNECVDGGGTWTWSTDQMLTDMDTFCMRCHDSDASRGAGLGGASGIAVNNTTNNDGAVTLSPTQDERLKPFNSTDAVDQGTGGGTVSLTGYERTAVIDAYGQFNPSNPSHHAVINKAYYTASTTDGSDYWGDAAWVDKTLKNGTRIITDGIYESAALHCADCHTVDYNSHGASNGFMLEASTIDGQCYLCHSVNVYSDSAVAGSRWDHNKDAGVWSTAKFAKIGEYGGSTGSACRNCHGGNIGNGGSFVDGYGGIHGLPSGADSRSGQERYRFIGGDYMSHAPASWTGTSGGTPTCYFAASTSQDWSNCTQHSGSDTKRTMSPVYSRGVPGQY